MANNRLYILDTETGEKFYLAKGYTYWQLRPKIINKLNQWLKERDVESACGSITKLKLQTEWKEND